MVALLDIYPLITAAGNDCISILSGIFVPLPYLHFNTIGIATPINTRAIVNVTPRTRARVPLLSLGNVVVVELVALVVRLVAEILLLSLVYLFATCLTITLLLLDVRLIILSESKLWNSS